MEKRITFRGTEQSAAVKNQIEERVKKLESFLEHEKQPIVIDVIIEPSKVHAHDRVEIRVHNPEFTIISEYEGADLYQILEKALDTMVYRLHEKKRELVAKRKSE